MNCAVPIALGGKTPKLMYVQSEAATVWLKTCVAYLTFILLKLFGWICLSVSLCADLIVSSLSLL